MTVPQSLRKASASGVGEPPSRKKTRESPSVWLQATARLRSSSAWCSARSVEPQLESHAGRTCFGARWCGPAVIRRIQWRR